MATKICKSDLINSASEKTGRSKKAAKEIIDAFINDIQDALVNEDIVTLQGFGRLYTRQARGRSFRKIKSTEIINVGERSLPKIKFSKKFIERVKK